MLALTKEFSLEVSEFYLRLATESIRLYSNKSRNISSFGDMIDDMSSEARLLTQYYDILDMQQHLSIIPTTGDIPIKFTILETSASSLEAAAGMLQEAIGRYVAFADTLSLIMYDFIIDENRTEVLTKLGLSSEEAERYRVLLKKKPSNVVPFK